MYLWRRSWCRSFLSVLSLVLVGELRHSLTCFEHHHSCVLHYYFYSRVGWLFFCESVLSGAGHRRRQLCGGLEPVGASSQLCFVLLPHFTPRPLRLTVPLAVLLIPPSAIIYFDDIGGWRSGQ